MYIYFFLTYEDECELHIPNSTLHVACRNFLANYLDRHLTSCFVKKIFNVKPLKH